MIDECMQKLDMLVCKNLMQLVLDSEISHSLVSISYFWIELATS